MVTNFRRVSSRLLVSSFGAITFTLIAGQSAKAADPAPASAPVDKSIYSLFNPTPDDKLRDFSPDRPTKVFGTSTVDAGRFQIESDLFNYGWDPRKGAVSTRQFSFPNPTLKIGILSFWELGIQTSMYNSYRQSGPGVNVSVKSYGDTSIINKFNIFGNDGGDQALAIVPVVKFGTADTPLGNGHTDYSLFVPFKTALPSAFTLIVQPGVSNLRNSTNTGYATNYSFIANISHTLFTDTLTASAEIFWQQSNEDRIKPQASFDTALQWSVTKNFAIDVGINFGLNKVTQRYNPYIGFAYRF